VVIPIPVVAIHQVWANNLEEAFAKIRSLAQHYRFVAMDTAFPGVVAKPLGHFEGNHDYNYQQMAVNVNMLKLIQVGLALMDADGNLPPTGDVWQFNFDFNLHDDPYSTESIELLRNAGFDFDRHKSEGICMDDFGKLLNMSGLLRDAGITWLTFQCGYHFGFLMRSLRGGDLPLEEAEFFQLHRAMFPHFFDLKLVLRQPAPVAVKLFGGLQKVADQLQVQRIGKQHQAASDALLIGQTFFTVKQRFFSTDWDKVAVKLQGHLYGLGGMGEQPKSPLMMGDRGGNVKM